MTSVSVSTYCAEAHSFSLKMAGVPVEMTFSVKSKLTTIIAVVRKVALTVLAGIVTGLLFILAVIQL